MYKIFAIMGIVGSIICALGDYFLYRCQGMDSVRIGEAKKIESGWKDARIDDFVRSGILGAIGIPLYYFGMIAFSYALSLENMTLAIVYFIMITIASMGAVAFHLNACYMPVIYRTVSKSGESMSMVEDVYSAMRKVCNLSSVITYALLVFVNSVFIYVVIVTGVIEISKLWCLVTPLSLFIIGNVLKKINNKVFHTFPLAVTNTLGLGGIALIALFSL